MSTQVTKTLPNDIIDLYQTSTDTMEAAILALGALNVPKWWQCWFSYETGTNSCECRM